MNIYIYEYTCICIAWQYKLIDITNMLFAIQNHSANINEKKCTIFVGGGCISLSFFFLILPSIDVTSKRKTVRLASVLLF